MHIPDDSTVGRWLYRVKPDLCNEDRTIMPHTISAYYEAAPRFFSLGTLFKTTLYLAIGTAIAFYAVPSSAALSPDAGIALSAPLGEVNS
jgi:hypothetical protein